jgi:hypothetical protein
MSKPTRKWHSLFEGTVPKDHAFPESNEDKVRICDDEHLYVMSDGASESYNSALWAEVLVESACSEPPHSQFVRWLKRAIATYEDRSDRKDMSWSQEAAFNRGSFASLLVVELLRDHIKLTSIGDTEALLIKNGKISQAFPYKEAHDFQRRPNLLSTLLSRHNTPYFQQVLRSLVAKKISCSSQSGCKAWWHYPSSSDSLLLCVTDALAEWLLRKDGSTQARLNKVIAVRNQEDLTRLVEEARREDKMRKDDSSLIILGEEHATSDT